MPVNNLNLLPPELSVSKDLNGLLKTLRALGVIAIAAFLIFGIGVAAFFIISTISLNGINANVVRLTGQVSAQQKSEQQIFLVKDRIAKIITIQQFPDSLPNLAAIDTFLSSLSENSSVNEISIDPAAVTLSVNLKTNSDLSTFLESLQSSGVFQSIIITSFNLNTASGYALEIKAVR